MASPHPSVLSEVVVWRLGYQGKLYSTTRKIYLGEGARKQVLHCATQRRKKRAIQPRKKRERRNAGRDHATFGRLRPVG